MKVDDEQDEPASTVKPELDEVKQEPRFSSAQMKSSQDLDPVEAKIEMQEDADMEMEGDEERQIAQTDIPERLQLRLRGKPKPTEAELLEEAEWIADQLFPANPARQAKVDKIKMVLDDFKLSHIDVSISQLHLTSDPLHRSAKEAELLPRTPGGPHLGHLGPGRGVHQVHCRKKPPPGLLPEGRPAGPRHGELPDRTAVRCPQERPQEL